MSSRNSTLRKSRYRIPALLLVMTLASCGRHPSAHMPGVYIDLDHLVRLHPSQGAVQMDAMTPLAGGSHAVPADRPVHAPTFDRAAPTRASQRREARTAQRLDLIRARLEGREQQALNREIAQIRFESDALLADQALAHRAVWLTEALQVIDDYRGRLAETDLIALSARLTADSMPTAQAARAALDASLAGRREVRTAFTRRLSEVDSAYFRRLEEARADVYARRDARIEAARSASAYRMERLLRRVSTVTGWTGDGSHVSGKRTLSASVPVMASAKRDRPIGGVFAAEQPLLAQQTAARTACRDWAVTYCQVNGKRAEFVRRSQPDWTQRVARDMEAQVP